MDPLDSNNIFLKKEFFNIIFFLFFSLYFVLLIVITIIKNITWLSVTTTNMLNSTINKIALNYSKNSFTIFLISSSFTQAPIGRLITSPATFSATGTLPVP